VCLAFLVVSLGGAALWARRAQPGSALDRHAAEYQRLALSLDALDPDFLDDGGQRAHDAGHLTASAIAERARALRAHIRFAHAPQAPARVENLALLLGATAARADLVGGRASRADASNLDEDLLRLSGLVLRDGSARGTAAIGRELDARLPGTGGLAQRLARYEARFAVPRARLHDVLTRAIAACRAQTAKHIRLPEGETLATEYVAGQAWSGQSVYQGRLHSVLRVNRGFAFPLDRLLTLACHEGYPGHHTYESLREAEMVRRRGWTELSATPLFTPQGFTAEAVATAAAAMAFSRDERVAVLRDELFPLAGFDPGEAAPYARVTELVEKAGEAIPPILGQYLRRNLSRTRAAEALERDAFMSAPAGTLAFADRYGVYSLAYTLGADLAMTSINAGARTAVERWSNLRRLIVSPLPLGAGGSIEDDEGQPRTGRYREAAPLSSSSR
jgi:hypothetical protein